MVATFGDHVCPLCWDFDDDIDASEHLLDLVRVPAVLVTFLVSLVEFHMRRIR